MPSRSPEAPPTRVSLIALRWALVECDGRIEAHAIGEPIVEGAHDGDAALLALLRGALYSVEENLRLKVLTSEKG